MAEYEEKLIKEFEYLELQGNEEKLVKEFEYLELQGNEEKLTKEEFEYLELRQRIKESIRKQMKNKSGSDSKTEQLVESLSKPQMNKQIPSRSSLQARCRPKKTDEQRQMFDYNPQMKKQITSPSSLQPRCRPKKKTARRYSNEQALDMLRKKLTISWRKRRENFMRKEELLRKEAKTKPN